MKPEQLLKRCGLSRTKARLHVVDLLNGSDQPVSGTDILQQLGSTCDKSTIYRTLNILFEKGLLARVIVDHEVKYALKAVVTETGKGESDHVHFKCDSCSRVYCLKDLEVSDFDLPEGFIKSENQFLIIGICKSCSEQLK